MDEIDALLDLLLVDIIAVSSVVCTYLIYVKLRSFFRGFKRLQSEHFIRSRLKSPGLANLLYGKSGRGSGSLESGNEAGFWVRYFFRKGLGKTLKRYSLQQRILRNLKKRPKHELEKIAFSIIFWSRHDCPNRDLYIARPPHHISLRDDHEFHDPRAAEERLLRMLALKAKSQTELLDLIMHGLSRRGSRSLQWVCDSLEAGWVEEMGITQSRIIKLNQENRFGKTA
jgi:hypothetical protein